MVEIKMLPHNIDAEESTLGGILFDPKAIEKVDAILPTEAFYVIAHQKIYRAAIALHRKEFQVDLMTVTSYLRDTGKLEEIGGISRLANLAERTISAINIDRHAILVLDKYRRRLLLEATSEIADLTGDMTIETDKVLDAAEQKLFEISRKRGISNTEKNAPIAIAAYDGLADQSPIYPTGFYDLDKLMVGFEPGTLTLLAGRPSMGKTAVGLSLALAIAINQKIPVAFFSLEMTKRQLEYRIWSALSVMPSSVTKGILPLDGDRIRRHRAGIAELTASEMNSIAQILEIAIELPIYINDDRGIAVSQIASECRQIRATEGQLGLVVVDYLQIMSGDPTGNRSYELGDIARGLYKMAGDLGVPVLALSQISRGVESRADKRPSMADLSQSGVLEMIADNILFAYREEYYNPNPSNQGVLQLILGKARHGSTGSVDLYFDKIHGSLGSLLKR